MPTEQNIQVIQPTYEITMNKEPQANYHQDNGDNINQHQRNTQRHSADRSQEIDLEAKGTTKDNDITTSITEITNQINDNNNGEQLGIMPQYKNTRQYQETIIIDKQSPQGTNSQEPTTQRPQLIQQTMNQYSSNPAKSNESWGASINNLAPTIFRIYFQNINGLQYKTTNSRWQPHLDYMKDKGISISGLAETNSSWHHKHFTRQIRAKASNAFKNSSVVFQRILSIRQMGHSIYQEEHYKFARTIGQQE
jgi:hypothetical protein